MENLHENPKWVTIALEEILDVVKSHADDDSLSRAIRHAKRSLIFSRDEEKDNDYSETQKKFAALQTKLFEAWLELLRFQEEHCYDDNNVEEDDCERRCDGCGFVHG